MRELFMLHPEVAGDLGSKTIVKKPKANVEYPEVEYLEYRFNVWLGDELLEAFPCFIVTETLAKDLKKANLSGLRLGEMEISKSETFIELYPRRRLPKFRRLIPEGTVKLQGQNRVREWSGEDFCMNERAELIVTDKALGIISQHKIEHCKIQELIIPKTLPSNE